MINRKISGLRIILLLHHHHRHPYPALPATYRPDKAQLVIWPCGLTLPHVQLVAILFKRPHVLNANVACIEVHGEIKTEVRRAGNRIFISPPPIIQTSGIEGPNI